jgi:hypothetical protein
VLDAAQAILGSMSLDEMKVYVTDGYEMARTSTPLLTQSAAAE